MRSIPFAATLILTMVLLPARGEAQDLRAPAGAGAPCTVTFDSLALVLRQDYPGFVDKVPGHADLLAAADSARAEAVLARGWRPCVAALQHWVRALKDPHMLVWYSGPPAPIPAAATPATEPTRPASAAMPAAHAAEDPATPALTFVDDSTAVLRLPDFAAGRRTAIEGLLAAHRDRLARTPDLIVDLRGNGGGCSCSYDSVIPLLYTGPIHREGADILSSPGNIALLRGWLASDLPESTRAQIRSVLPVMTAHPGELVPFSPDEDLRLDTVLPLPRAVAVVIDRGCASSCEGFVLDARQSRKVVVVGAENTGGFLDYGNVHNVRLPGWYVLRVPATRSHHVAERRLDGVGLAPDVRIAAGADPVAAARACLPDRCAAFRQH